MGIREGEQEEGKNGARERRGREWEVGERRGEGGRVKERGEGKGTV